MMKNVLYVCGICLLTVHVMAGGNVQNHLPAVVQVPVEASKDSLTYMEDDTNLMWQDQRYSEAEYGAFKRNHSLGKVGSHSHAVQYCSRLHYAGFSDWRLPTSDELTHVHRHRGNAFVFSQDNDFWTSTPTVGHKYYVVFPADAYRYARSVKQSNFIRCVRAVKH